MCLFCNFISIFFFIFYAIFLTTTFLIQWVYIKLYHAGKFHEARTYAQKDQLNKELTNYTYKI